MTGKEIMITTLRRSTIALLASSLLLTIGRGATLPFMTIYLTRRYQLDVDVIGYALSLALVVASSDFAEKVVAVVLPVNAAVVVALQYAVGRRLSARNIRPLMTFGTVCFVIGLVGFMFSGASLWAWGISAAIFTLGEVIYAPGEYMLIDHIAPPGMKASYFSAQSLGWLGAAFNPMLTGLILTHLPHWSLFVILIVAIVAAWLMIFRGINARPWQPDSPLANA